MATSKDTSLADAWQRLEKTLVDANKHYLMYSDGGRAAVVRQVVGITQFIRTVAPGRPLLQIPLIALRLALHYLDHGIVEPMLLPNRSGRGRRPDRPLIKIRSAVTMTQLYNIGYHRNEAAKLVAGELNKLGFRTSYGAVVDWRDDFSKRPPDDEIGSNYRAMFEEAFKLAEFPRSRSPIQDQSKRAKVAARHLETLKKFIVLSRLTKDPNLWKLRQSLKSELSKT